MVASGDQAPDLAERDPQRKLRYFEGLDVERHFSSQSWTPTEFGEQLLDELLAAGAEFAT